ncbi:MAG: hypothetical protein IPP47_16210 [Bryobacterales bacterium]|nr:hypothetical protein [Bryobacterales bacterium]
MYDPQKEEEGCFAWDGGELKRMTVMALRDEPSGPGDCEDHRPSEWLAEEAVAPEAPARSRRARIVRWAALVLSHVFALLLGAVIGALLAPQITVIPEGPETGLGASAPNAEYSQSSAPQEGGKR